MDVNRQPGSGGIVDALLFGAFVAQGVDAVALGCYIGVALMIAAGIVEVAFGVEASRTSREDIAEPITAQHPSGA